LIGFKELPENWREKAHQLFGTTAADYIRWSGTKRIVIDSDCPLQISIIIIDEELRVYRIDDLVMVNLILRSSSLPPILTEVNFPSAYLFSESPPLN